MINEFLTKEEIEYYTRLGINLDSDLVDPKVDSVFKTMFTSDSEESRKALIHFLTCVIGRQINHVEIKNNELPTTGLLQKQSMFDVHVSFNNGEEADIEMQMQIKDNLLSRSEYNTARLYSSQDIKGKLYSNLKKVYSIMVLNCTLFHDTDEFFDEYMYRNSKGKLLSGNTQIAFIELTKLDRLMGKQVSDMTGLEKWAFFLKYANDGRKQRLVKEILESEEGIKMGAQVLETISKDRDEFIKYYHHLKAEVDKESQLLYARNEGKVEGIMEGKLEACINMVVNFQVSVEDAIKMVGLDGHSKDTIMLELQNRNVIYKE